MNIPIKINNNHKVRLLLYSLLFFVLLGIFFYKNSTLFIKPIYEYGDNAADSILIDKAKELNLFVGHYSRFGFNHPGPFFLYAQAWSEIVLHDIFHIVPTPYNAHVVGIFLLNVFFAATTIYIFSKHFNSNAIILSLMAVLTLFFAVNPEFMSTWMPDVIIMPFLLFIASAAVVASGRVNYLWALALSGGSLIHGYVGMPLFVVPVSLFAVFMLFFAKKPFHFFKENRLHIILFVVTIILFLLPVAINTIINFPGEIPKYISHLQKTNTLHNPKGIYDFFNRYWFDKNMGIVIFSVLFVTAFVFTRIHNNDFSFNLIKCSLMATIIFLYYIARVVDDLSLNYTATFYKAIPMLLILLIVAHCVLELEKSLTCKHAILVVFMTVTVLLMSLYNTSKSIHVNLSYMPDAIKSINIKRGEKIVIRFEHDFWPYAVSMVLHANRMSSKIYIDKRYLEFMFTTKYICVPQDKEKIKYINMIKPENCQGKILFANNDFALTEQSSIVRTMSTWGQPNRLR